MIAKALRAKFPKANFLKDIILQDDGDGPYIKEWNIPDAAKPSKATIKKWEKEVKDEPEKYLTLEDKVNAILNQFNYMRLGGQELIQPLDDAINQWLQETK